MVLFGGFRLNLMRLPRSPVRAMASNSTNPVMATIKVGGMVNGMTVVAGGMVTTGSGAGKMAAMMVNISLPPQFAHFSNRRRCVRPVMEARRPLVVIRVMAKMGVRASRQERQCASKSDC